ncbi:udp-glycosyltransferase 74f1 [Quercus suber]|uniref:Udp-glycosyltransferase 74f1 n=1 Tax=Quercus suber TaxID=58331 RepID=A0AAW0JUH7_QUESU
MLLEPIFLYQVPIPQFDFPISYVNRLIENLTRLKDSGSKTLAELIRKYKHLGRPIDCIVYDSSLSWALDAA